MEGKLCNFESISIIGFISWLRFKHMSQPFSMLKNKNKIRLIDPFHKSVSVLQYMATISAAVLVVVCHHSHHESIQSLLGKNQCLMTFEIAPFHFNVSIFFLSK